MFKFLTRHGSLEKMLVNFDNVTLILQDYDIQSKEPNGCKLFFVGEPDTEYLRCAEDLGRIDFLLVGVRQ